VALLEERDGLAGLALDQSLEYTVADPPEIVDELSPLYAYFVGASRIPQRVLVMRYTLPSLTGERMFV